MWDSHVLHGDVFEDLAVVHVPDGLVVPDLGGQQDGAQHHPLPVPGTDVDLGVGQQPLQVDLPHGKREMSETQRSTATMMMVKQEEEESLTSVTMAHSEVS